MKWLLVTSIGPNPGDQFIRVGVQRLIESVDDEPDYWLLHKETSAIGEPIAFDRAVWCGMPVFWSHPRTWSWSVGWWGAIRGGWLSADPRRFLIHGAGSFAAWPGDPQVAEPERLHDETAILLDGGWRCIARDPVVATITGHPIETMACPAVFATHGHEPLIDGVQLCNLMPNGGHYRIYGEDEAVLWDRLVPYLAEMLLEREYRFVAHNEIEREFALSLGWAHDRIFTDSRDPRYLLSVYAGCIRYVGNRIHGAIVAAGAGADTWSIGYDSRQEAVRMCGGRVSSPSTTELDQVLAWLDREPTPVAFNVNAEFERQSELFARFAAND